MGRGNDILVEILYSEHSDLNAGRGRIIMGKSGKKNKQNKNQQTVLQKKQMQESKELAVLKLKLTSQIDDMSYAEALETLAKLIEKKCYDPEVLYQGAQAYFYLGDYERAASWVNNTLHYAPQHVEARLLLAKICLLEDRSEDAMELYTFVLRNNGESLSKGDLEQIKEGVDYTWRTDRQWLEDKYPLVASLWKKQTDKHQKAEISMTSETEMPSADNLIEQIMVKDASLLVKINLFNAFAGSYLIARDYAAAEELLVKALELDAYHQQTLINMAVLAKMQGNEEKALTFAAKLPQTDFRLLNLLM